MFVNTQSTSLFVWAVFFGICFAIVIIFFQRNAVSDFISSLIKFKAFDENSALSFDDLSIKSSLWKRIISSAISGQRGLARIIGISKDRYYLKNNDIEIIKKKYVVKRTPLWKILVSIVILFAIALCSVNIIDMLGKYAKDTFSGSAYNGNDKKDEDENSDENKAEENADNAVNDDDNALKDETQASDTEENTDTSDNPIAETDEELTPTIPKGPKG